jgi:fructokinase
VGWRAILNPVLTVIGEALIDFIGEQDGVHYAARPGGSPLNVAVGLARLGNPTAMMARLSGGALGDRLRTHATGNGVDLAWAPVATEAASLAVVSLDDAGHAAYDFYVDGTADRQWRDDELQQPPDTTVVHTGSLATWIEPGASRIAAMLERSENLLVSFDPNARPRLMGAGARERIERFVALAHVVKASDEDLNWLYPDSTPEEVAQDWLARGPGVVVVTLGGAGCVAFTAGGEVIRRPAVDVTMVDTVGAGDSFMAALLDGLVRGGWATPALLADADLVSVIERASRAAGLTCQRPGADPPTLTELDGG